MDIDIARYRRRGKELFVEGRAILEGKSKDEVLASLR